MPPSQNSAVFLTGFVQIQFFTGSVSVINTAKLEHSSIKDTSGSKLGGAIDAAKSKLSGVTDNPTSKLGGVVDTATVCQTYSSSGVDTAAKSDSVVLFDTTQSKLKWYY
jgi:hypothetical protein